MRELTDTLLASQKDPVTDPYIIIFLSMLEQPPPLEGYLALLSRNSQQVWVYDDDTGLWTLQSDESGPGNFSQLSQTFTGHWLYVGSRGELGDVWHSPDGVDFTKTWTHLTAGGYNSGVWEYDISPDGTVWILVGNSAAHVGANAYKPLRIYKSEDGGATWTLVYTDEGFDYAGDDRNTGPRTIAASQTDSDIVVVCCEGRFNVEPDSIYTIDGGNTWVRRINPTQDFPRGAGNYDHMRFAASGRLLYLTSQAVCKVWYSDDLGESWTQATETTPFNSPVGRRLGWWRSNWGSNNIMICDRPAGTPSPQHVKVFVSKDNGASWDKVDADDPTFPYTAWGVDYDAVKNKAAVSRYATASANIVGLIDDPFGTPTKSDITSNISVPFEPGYAAPLAYPR